MADGVKKNNVLNRYAFIPPKRAYTLDMFRRKHLIWIPQSGRGPLPCIFVAPPKISVRTDSKKKKRENNIPMAPPVPDEVDQIVCHLERGENLILYTKSNSMDLASSYEFVKRMAKRLHVYVLCFEFTGFGFALHRGQQMTPTESSTKKDIRVVYDFIRDSLNWPSERIIIFGEDIACGIACYGASFAQKERQETIGALCLRSAYTSMDDIIKPFLAPVTSLVLNRYNNIKLLTNVKCPLFITHGELDDCIPLNLSRKLFSSYKGHFLRKLHVAVGETHHLVENTSVFLPLAQFLLDIKHSNQMMEISLPKAPRIRIPEAMRIVPAEFVRAAMPEPISKSIREITAQGLNTMESLMAGKVVTAEEESIRLTNEEELRAYLEIRLTKFVRAIAANHYVRVNAVEKVKRAEQKSERAKLSPTMPSSSSDSVTMRRESGHLQFTLSDPNAKKLEISQKSSESTSSLFSGSVKERKKKLTSTSLNSIKRRSVNSLESSNDAEGDDGTLDDSLDARPPPPPPPKVPKFTIPKFPISEKKYRTLSTSSTTSTASNPEPYSPHTKINYKQTQNKQDDISQFFTRPMKTKTHKRSRSKGDTDMTKVSQPGVSCDSVIPPSVQSSSDSSSKSNEPSTLHHSGNLIKDSLSRKMHRRTRSTGTEAELDQIPTTLPTIRKAHTRNPSRELSQSLFDIITKSHKRAPQSKPTNENPMETPLSPRKTHKRSSSKNDIEIQRVTAMPSLSGQHFRPQREKSTISKKEFKKWVEGQYYFYAPLLDMYMEIEQLHVIVGPGPVPHVLGAGFKAIGSAPYGLLHVQLRIGGLLYCWDRKSTAIPREMYFKHVYNVKKTRCRIPIFFANVPKEFFSILMKWLTVTVDVDLRFNEYLEHIETQLSEIIPELVELVVPLYTGPSFGGDNTSFFDKMKVWGQIVLKWERECYYHAAVSNCQHFFIQNCAALKIRIPGEANKEVQRATIALYPNTNQEALFKASPFSADTNAHVNAIYKGKTVMAPKYESVEDFIGLHNCTTYKWDSPDYSVMAAQWDLQTCPQYTEELCSILSRACKKFRKICKACSKNIK